MKMQFALASLAGLAMFSSCEKTLEEPEFSVTVVAEELTNPWGMGFLPNNDFIFTERTGEIHRIKSGSGETELLMTRTVQVSEGGLLGLAVDPQFSSNHYIYIYETTTFNRIVRLQLDGDNLTEDQVILDNIPSNVNHDGGALKFGPDGYLYAGTGDAQDPDLSQDTTSLAGKILRIDRDGNPAAGNPFSNEVWSYGHRNVQGLAWASNGNMYATEHGPSSEFGWCCHDEVNRISKGGNYGWPLVIGDDTHPGVTLPYYHTGDATIAPSGCAVISGSQWGTWHDQLLVAGLRGQSLSLVTLVNPTVGHPVRTDYAKEEYGRIRNIVLAPDGSIYFCTSNQGSATPGPGPGDDKIYRMTAQ